MTITHKEFFRLLPKALDGLSHKIIENQVRANLDRGSVSISLSDEYTRKLGSLVLPTTQVKIELVDLAESQADKFMLRFDLAYQKGGG